MSNAETKSILMVAGEPSGDKAAANVARRIAEQLPCRIFGVGGEQMKLAGVKLVAHIDRLTSLGFAESAVRLGRWLGVWASIRREVELKKPKVALLVDTPEINLPLARVLKENGVTVVWYIGPQVWAWRAERLGLLKKRTDVVALILPFEKPLYDAQGVNATFVGHPILDEPSPKPKELVRSFLGVAPADELVAFLPGSRKGEIERHSEKMISAAALLGNKGIKSVFAPLPGAAGGSFAPLAKAAGMAMPPSDFSSRDVMAAADAAIVASGTATLEAAVFGTPLAVVYVLDRFSWAAGKLLANIPYVSLPNWVAGRKISPEILQGDFSADSIYGAAVQLLGREENERQKKELAQVAASLGAPGAAARVAKLVIERMG